MIVLRSLALAEVSLLPGLVSGRGDALVPEVMGRNRHGVATFAEPERCIFPSCPRSAWDGAPLHMCRAHVMIAVDHGKRALAEDERRRAERLRAVQLGRSFEEPTAPPQKPTATSCLYLIRVGGNIKLGWTADLRKRMRDYPPDSLLLATCPGSRRDEQRLHKRYAHLLSHGREWYPLSPDLLRLAEEWKSKHGAPEQVDFGAKPVQVPAARVPQVVALRSRSGGRYKR